MQASLHANIINMHVNADIITQILLLQYVQVSMCGRCRLQKLLL